MPRYDVQFSIETENEPSDALLDNALLAGIRYVLPIFAQHGTKVKDNSDSEFDLGWQMRLNDEESDDDESSEPVVTISDGEAGKAVPIGERTSAPPAAPDDATDSEPHPST